MFLIDFGNGLLNLFNMFKRFPGYIAKTWNVMFPGFGLARGSQRLGCIRQVIP